MTVEFKADATIVQEIPAALSERLVNQDAGKCLGFDRQTSASASDYSLGGGAGGDRASGEWRVVSDRNGKKVGRIVGASRNPIRDAPDRSRGKRPTQMTGGVNAKGERRSATVRLLFRNCSEVVWV